jgi:hypothetical protein
MKHGVRSHLYLPMFPNEADLQRYGLNPQGKHWKSPKSQSKKQSEGYNGNKKAKNTKA